MEEFQRHAASGARVFSAKDNTLPAPAELFDQSIVADPPKRGVRLGIAGLPLARRKGPVLLLDGLLESGVASLVVSELLKHTRIPVVQESLDDRDARTPSASSDDSACIADGSMRPGVSMTDTLDQSPEPGRFDTSFHTRAAADGQRESLNWLVQRFTPLLLAQAERRMGAVLRRHHDPEDLVNDVWSIAVPRLSGLEMSDQRHASVLAKFLGTTLLRRVRDLARRHRDAPEPIGEREQNLPDEITGIVTNITRREQRNFVWECLSELDDADRDVVIFRGIEQRPHREIAALMGIEVGTVAVRYHRALKKLRLSFPKSVFEDLPDIEETLKGGRALNGYSTKKSKGSEVAKN